MLTKCYKTILLILLARFHLELAKTKIRYMLLNLIRTIDVGITIADYCCRQLNYIIINLAVSEVQVEEESVKQRKQNSCGLINHIA